MSNRWGVTKEVEEFVRKRDTNCIYCRIEFVSNEASTKLGSSWEHIINDIRLNSSDNIALCCRSCNASKGTKKLEDWLQSNYCSNKGINRDSVAQVAKNYLKKLLNSHEGHHPLPRIKRRRTSFAIPFSSSVQTKTKEMNMWTELQTQSSAGSTTKKTRQASSS